MSHLHTMTDNDTVFIIDGENRSVTNKNPYVKLMQYDSNSEIFTFVMPRHIEGHDMTLCDHVQIHYCNNGKDSYVNDYYEVTDLRIKPGTENTLIFTWPVGWSATSKEGTLDFTIRFMCTTGEETDYVWNTNMFTGIPIEKSVYSTDKIIEQNSDAFNAILARVDEVENKAETSETKVDQFDERITALEETNNSSQSNSSICFVNYHTYNYIDGNVDKKAVIIDGEEYEFSPEYSDTTSNYPSNLTFKQLSERIEYEINSGRPIYYTDGPNAVSGVTVLNDCAINKDFDGNIVSIRLYNIHGMYETSKFSGCSFLSYAGVKGIELNNDNSIVWINKGNTMYDEKNDYREIIFHFGDNNTVKELRAVTYFGTGDTIDLSSNSANYSNIVSLIEKAMYRGTAIFASSGTNDGTPFYCLNNIKFESNYPTIGAYVCLSYNGFNVEDNSIGSESHCHILIRKNGSYAEVTYSVS